MHKYKIDTEEAYSFQIAEKIKTRLILNGSVLIEPWILTYMQSLQIATLMQVLLSQYYISHDRSVK